MIGKLLRELELKIYKNSNISDCTINSPKFGIHDNHYNIFHNKQFDTLEIKLLYCGRGPVFSSAHCLSQQNSSETASVSSVTTE